MPLHTDGYSVDDVARGLLVVCREPSPSRDLIVLGRRYLYFLGQAQALGGKLRDHLDVTYEQDAGTPEEMVDQVTSTLAEEGGLLRCRHVGRLIVLYGRGVATLEVAPRGAVL